MILDKLIDKVQGKFEKMVIEAYETVDDAGKPFNKKKDLRVLINPETYSLKHSVVLVKEDVAAGKGSSQQKFNYIAPKELTFDFLFDDTGIIDGEIRDFLKKPSGGVHEEVEEFRIMLMGYKGNPHQPYVVRLAWGALIFVGRAQEMEVTYKLFRADGTPIRAMAKVKFVETIEEVKGNIKDGNQSPDLTHVLRVKSGDTLPLLCKKIYGDPKYYFQVAAANGLGNFRQLRPGMDLVFPPIKK